MNIAKGLFPIVLGVSDLLVFRGMVLSSILVILFIITSLYFLYKKYIRPMFLLFSIVVVTVVIELLGSYFIDDHIQKTVVTIGRELYSTRQAFGHTDTAKRRMVKSILGYRVMLVEKENGRYILFDVFNYKRKKLDLQNMSVSNWGEI